MPQLNPQTSAPKFKPQSSRVLLLGLGPESGSGHVTRLSHLTAPGGTRVGARDVDRRISIARPTIAYPFADPLLSQPHDLDRTAAASSSSSRSAALACAVRHGRGVGRASSRHLRADSTAPSAAHLLLDVHRPRKSSFTCSHRPRCSLGGPEHPRHPCRCSPPSWLLKPPDLLRCLPLASPQP